MWDCSRASPWPPPFPRPSYRWRCCRCSAGAIFTLPALILLHHWSTFDYWWTLAIVGLGGLLGVLFSLPLRRTLIIEQKLRFPEGIAAAEVLKVGANPGIGAKFLGLATIVGGTFKLITS